MRGKLEQLQGHLAAAGQAFDQALNIAGNDLLLWIDIRRLRYAGGEQVQAAALPIGSPRTNRPMQGIGRG